MEHGSWFAVGLRWSTRSNPGPPGCSPTDQPSKAGNDQVESMYFLTTFSWFQLGFIKLVAGLKWSTRLNQLAD